MVEAGQGYGSTTLLLASCWFAFAATFGLALAVDAEDRAHLAGRHPGAVGPGPGARADAHAALRPRRVRGHPLLRGTRRHLGHLPAARAHRSPVRLGARARPGDAVLARAAHGGVSRDRARERAA